MMNNTYSEIGNNASEWKKTQLKRVLNSIKDGTHGTYERTSAGYPLLSAKNVFDNGIKTGENESYISEDDYQSIISNGYPRKGDVLMSIVGTVGRTCVYEQDVPMAFQRSVAFLRCNERMSPYYLKYYLQSPHILEEEKLSSNGTAQVGLYLGAIEKLPILIPFIFEQTAIATYLDEKCGAIDEIIAEAKASIEEYKAWKSSVIFEAVTKGLDPHAEMKDSGVEWIGKVPRHWNVCKLKYLCSMQAGKNISSELIQDRGEYPVYGGNGLRGYYSNFNMEQDCILVGRQGALCGNVHIVSGKYWATEHAVITQVTNIENLQHLYYLLIGMNLNQYASDAAAQPGLAVGAIKDIYVPLTPKSEQEAIITALDEKCAAIDGIIAEKEALIADMEAYKKSLIFETVTGKRKVC